MTDWDVWRFDQSAHNEGHERQILIRTKEHIWVNWVKF